MMCERALSRESHGKMIAEHQMVQEAIADSYAEINMLRLLVLWTAWTIDNSSTQEARTQIAACKYTCAKVLREVSYRALHIMGSLGTTNLTPLQAMWASAPTMAITDGVDEVHKVTVARNVLKGYEPHDGPVADRVHPGQARGGPQEVRQPARRRPRSSPRGPTTPRAPRQGATDMDINGQGRRRHRRRERHRPGALPRPRRARAPAGVVVADIDGGGAAQTVAAEIEAAGHSGAGASPADMAREADVQALVAAGRGGVRARSTCSAPTPASSSAAASRSPTRRGRGSGRSTCRATSTRPARCCRPCWPGARATW